MKKNLIFRGLVTALVVLLGGTGWAQSGRSAVPQKPSFNKELRPQLLSQYIREIGLLYIETLERARTESSRAMQDNPKGLQSHGDPFASVDTLDDRIAINVTNSTDKEFASFLKLLRSHASLSATTRNAMLTFAARRDRASVESYRQSLLVQDRRYIFCRERLKTLILAGQYSSDKDAKGTSLALKVCLSNDDSALGDSGNPRDSGSPATQRPLVQESTVETPIPLERVDVPALTSQPPNVLLGKSPMAVRSLIGTPSLIAGETWSYETAQGTLRVTFAGGIVSTTSPVGFDLTVLTKAR